MRQFAGAGGEEGQWPEGIGLEPLLKQLARRHGDGFGRIIFDEQGRLRPSLLILVNDAAVRSQAPPDLADGDQVTLLPAISGG